MKWRALSSIFVANMVVLSTLSACTETIIVNQAPSPKKDAGKTTTEDSGTPEDVDASVVDTGFDSGYGKASQCASTFGTALTDAFGRLDGVVTAIVQPKDQQCVAPNKDHVILQVRANGAVYRMVVNIQSDFGTDVRVRYAQVNHALVGGSWSEGWHAPASLDYVADLGIHANANGFTPYTLEELSPKITDDIEIGDKVSVFADSSGGSSAHKIHRNLGGDDGAIVLHANSGNPKYMVFHFVTQTF